MFIDWKMLLKNLGGYFVNKLVYLIFSLYSFVEDSTVIEDAVDILQRFLNFINFWNLISF